MLDFFFKKKPEKVKEVKKESFPRDFDLELRKDIEEALKEYPDTATFLRKKFGIEDVMSRDYKPIDKAIVSNKNSSKIRGNTQLQQGKVLSKEKAEELIARALRVSL